MDLRNHGRSAELRLEPPHDMANAANDVADLVKAEGWAWPDVVIGHSMGGKVALHFAQSCAHAVYGQSAASPEQVFLLLSTFLTIYLTSYSCRFFFFFFLIRSYANICKIFGGG